MNQHLKELAAVTALNSMFNENHFSICTLDRVASLLGRRPEAEAYRLLRTLHCIDYADMPAELRDALPGLVAKCIGTEPVFQFPLPVAAPAPPPPPPERTMKPTKRLAWWRP